MLKQEPSVPKEPFLSLIGLLGELLKVSGYVVKLCYFYKWGGATYFKVAGFITGFSN